MAIKKKPVIFFLSKSGAGKDTQADLLIEQYKFHYINTGDLLRGLGDKTFLKSLKKDSSEYYEAKQILHIINHGKFVPTLSIVCQWRGALLNIIRNHLKTQGIVFVGSPRKLGEAMVLHDFFMHWPDAAKYFQIFPIWIKISYP